MASKIEMISTAMVLIGASPISSLTEGTEGIVADALYDTTYFGLLASHSWRFATKKVSLTKMTDAPLNEFQYQYQLPTDIITVGRVYNFSDYEIFGDKLYSDQETVEIDYRYKIDETILPDYFVMTLQFLLAAQFAIPITDNSQRATVYEGLYERQLQRAKYIDSAARPQNAIQHSPLTAII